MTTAAFLYFKHSSYPDVLLLEAPGTTSTEISPLFILVFLGVLSLRHFHLLFLPVLITKYISLYVLRACFGIQYNSN